MSNTKKSKGIAKFIVSAVILVVVILAVNITSLTFLPESFRTLVNNYKETYFGNNAISITFEAVVAAILTLFVAWITANVVKFLIGCVRFKRRRSETIRHLVSNVLKYLIYIAGVVLALGCLGVDTTAMFVSAGVVGIVVGFGAQSLIEDIITGLFIIFEGEFEVGDIITIDGFRGEVKTIGLRTVSIIDNGGNIRIINNSEISSLVNLSEVTSVAVVNVPVSYEDALEKSEAAVQEALSELPDEYPDIFKEAPFYKGVDVLAETHMELLVVANVAEENIYNARRIMQREIRFSCEKAGLTIPCREN